METEKKICTLSRVFQHALWVVDFGMTYLWAYMIVDECWRVIANVICLDSYTVADLRFVPLLLGLIVYRGCINVMIRTDDKRGWWLSLAFLVIGGFFYIFISFTALSFGSYLNPIRVFHYIFQDFELETVWKLIKYAGLICPIWILCVPLLYFTVRGLRHKLVRVNSLLKCATGTLYIYGISAAVYVIGVWMNKYGSLVGMILISGLVLWNMTGTVERKVKVILCAGVCIVCGLLWGSQFIITGKQFLFAAAGVVTVAVAIIAGIRCKSVVKAFSILVIPCLLIPSICIGYIFYKYPEYKRIGDFTCQSVLTGMVLLGDSEGHVGMMDRYLLIAPVQYETIRDYLETQKEDDGCVSEMP